jgi:FAD/FMN-containing dehydrogenase
MPTLPARHLTGWGRIGVPGFERRGEDLVRLTQGGAVLSRGLGRSYGDSALPPPGATEVVGTTLADRILGWDQETGRLRAEAGLSLVDLRNVLLPRGWFVPVSPGTQYVTLGGMVAADIHGKNHHVDGCIGRHVRRLRMRVADGRLLECSRDDERELFLATVGGMGLTGHILEVELDLAAVPSTWLKQESERVPDIDSFLGGLKSAAKQWPMTVGWIDCLATGREMGRGILIKGRWATPDEAPSIQSKPRRRVGVPFVAPGWLLGPLSVRAFNEVWYRKHPTHRVDAIVHPDAFFYPLDMIRNWNRLYGPRGFTQYQCVLPEAAGEQAPRRFLELLTQLGGASFLCVIKDCGEEGDGLLSFPLRGTSIALDIAVRDGTQALVDRLNAFVIDQGGRIYLAKDGFTRAEDFALMEPRLERFQEVRRTWDPDLTLRSAQSVRVLGDPA